MMRALGLIKQVKQFTRFCCSNSTLRKRTGTYKGLDEKDTEVIIKLGTGGSKYGNLFQMYEKL
jgi:hypothetical protein